MQVTLEWGLLTGPDSDTLPGFPGWSRLVKSHCTIPREDTVELHFKEGSKHMHYFNIPIIYKRPTTYIDKDP